MNTIRISFLQTIAGLFLIVFCSNVIWAHSWDELAYLGIKSHSKDDLQQAVDLLAQAASKKGEDNYELFLFAGILSARLGNVNESFDLLRHAIDAGMWDGARLERNPRLAPLKNDQRWIELIERINVREEEYLRLSGITHPHLRVELKSMWSIDQNHIGSGDRRRVIDANSIRLHQIVTEHGWPTYTMVGKDGAWFAWAIAQHSSDVDFQRICLSRMKDLLDTEEIDPKHFAELHDRIAKNSGTDQKYGMAIVKRGGKKFFYPIAELESVDQRRGEIGLPPLKVWANANGIDYW